LLVLHCSL